MARARPGGPWVQLERSRRSKGAAARPQVKGKGRMLTYWLLDPCGDSDDGLRSPAPRVPPGPPALETPPADKNGSP
jgi:hypothetical protein